MKKTTKVRVTNDGVKGFFTRAREHARKLDRGEPIAPEFVVSFEDADDMLRGAAVAATESVRDTLAPREIEPAYLRGVLVTEADVLRFMNAKRDKVVEPAELIEMLVACGLLNRNQINWRLQFAYDPVAEQLYAWRAAQGAAAGQAVPLRERVRASPDTALARTVAEYEGALHPTSAL